MIKREEIDKDKYYSLIEECNNYPFSINDIELKDFDTLLSLPDNDLWDMITSKKKVEDIKLQPVLQLLQIS